MNCLCLNLVLECSQSSLFQVVVVFWFFSWCFSLMLSVFSLPALVWLRSTEDVGEELEEMRKEAVEQRNSVKVRTWNGAFGW